MCATRLGREVLRKKGVYALLREFDRATQKRGEEQMEVLGALIGVLIRREEEMGLEQLEQHDDPLTSIRHLGT